MSVRSRPFVAAAACAAAPVRASHGLMCARKAVDAVQDRPEFAD